MRSYNDRVTETEVLAGIVGAVAARARAMTPEFDPGGFLEGLSRQLQGLIPHALVTVLYLDEGGRTVSVFAEHTSGDAPRHDGRYTLSLARASRYPIAEAVSSCVFAGQVEFVRDAQSDARCMAGTAGLGVPQAGGRPREAVPPLCAASGHRAPLICHTGPAGLTRSPLPPPPPHPGRLRPPIRRP